MDFSDKLRHSIPCEYSPDGKWIATVDGVKLYIRDVETLDVEMMYKNVGVANKIEWSKDSLFILCSQNKRGIVQIHSLEYKKWKCKISEGVAGVSGARWCPDSRHILTVQNHQLGMTIWSLCENKRWIIRHPKYSTRGNSFTTDGKLLAVLERNKFKDSIGIYSCQAWKMVKSFQVDTVDAEDISWSPDGNSIAVWDSNLEYNILVYSTNGRQLVKYKAYDGYLGIKKVSWSNSGAFLAVGSFDQKMRIINNLTWAKICDFNHPNTIEGHHTVVYEEKDEDWEENKTKFEADLTMRLKAHLPEIKGPTKYVIGRLPAQVIEVKPDPTSANLPKMGVGAIDWSWNDKFVFTRNDNMPNTLWIWNMKYLSLVSIIQHKSPIRCARWDPSRQRLIMCTGKNKLYLWTQEGCSIINVPIHGFNVRSLKWNPNGESFLLMDKDHFCCCYINDKFEEEDKEGEGEWGGAGTQELKTPLRKDEKELFPDVHDYDEKHGSSVDSLDNSSRLGKEGLLKETSALEVDK